MTVARGNGMSAMAPVYGSLIVKGEKDFSDVPTAIKEDVKAWLVSNGYEDMASEW